MGLLNQWINGKLAEIANKLPSLVHSDAASFACGYNTGYKQALLDLENHLDSMIEVMDELPEGLEDIYQTKVQMFEELGW